ncbi:tRNA uridine-5-carboxymethylaminomethyl(34) synthesis GTPase MnmE [Planococcaceae bacterium Storch 2/2-2]|nr:tRNA uridine-5-carboxymethylaminomethyl(34) synthesis GTPase MnmE [Planococcaceae bacterium Storch 2/2-2]
MQLETIAAISTPAGEGAIGIVRLSGKTAVAIADRIFRSPSDKRLEQVPTHTIHYGHLIDPSADDQVVEEVMVSVMRAPKTFTREDVVEINCHGGVTSVNRVLSLALRNGAQLAEPGEFTKRAFLNGRIDLAQAEAVMDLIRAQTDRAMDVALQQMEGRLSQLIHSLRQGILEMLAQVEVNIDYPEYDDVEEVTLPMLIEKSTWIEREIEQLLDTAKHGKIVREGLATVIIGRPNVGKSSLLNSLVQENKAIVTDIAGTTRDIIEEYVNVKGVPLRLVDTAGIRETSDVVEKIGVERSREQLERADLVLLVLNGAEPLVEEDEQLLNAAAHKEMIVLINKSDLPQQIDMDRVRSLVGTSPVIETSMKTEEGIQALERSIAGLFYAGFVEADDPTYISNVRHIELLHQALDAIREAKQGAELMMPVDMIQIDLTRTWDILGEIVGDTVQDGLINELFSQFCLGK